MSLHYKFGSDDLIKFIKIYRKHGCLWDPENANYKNRYVRNAALTAFAEEFGVNEFGPREIQSKIKNLRTQYHSERKKIKESMGSCESDTDDVYKPKLFWFDLMDSFLKPTTITEPRETTTEPTLLNENSIEKQETILFVNNEEDVSEEDDPITFENTKRKYASSSYAKMHLEKQEYHSKRKRLETVNDDLDNFGKYVTSTLRTLNDRNCIHAQDEIQAILSKYKLKNLQENERHYLT